METTENMKKYIATAELLSEAKNLSESSEIQKDASLQQMEALLASNCQKLCIGPSFHDYTSEGSTGCFKEKLYQMEARADDEKYETVIYNGPDAPYYIIQETNHPSVETIPPNAKLELMNAKLGNVSAEFGGLLSPQFFMESLGVSSSGSSRDTGASSDIHPDREMPETSDTDSQSGRNAESPFTSSVTNLNQEMDENPTDDIMHKLEKVEILDDSPSKENETEWVEWPKKYIESKGFSFGVQPGNFYKHKSRPHIYVKLPHRSNFEIVVTNNNQTPCDLDLYVNGQQVVALRLLEETTRSIDGPQYSDYAFKFFRASDAPPDKKVIEGAKQNGIVKAIFTPCKVGNARLRTSSEPLRAGLSMKDFLDIFEDRKRVKKQRSVTIAAGDEGRPERSLDMSGGVEGVTFLQGEQKKKPNYVLAPEMETDPSKRVILQLILIASLDEEIGATEEKVYDLEARTES